MKNRKRPGKDVMIRVPDYVRDYFHEKYPGKIIWTCIAWKFEIPEPTEDSNPNQTKINFNN